MQFEFAWHVLDRDDKARWVPEDHRAVLMADATWAPLLVRGPPACDFASTLPADGARGDVKGKGARSVSEADAAATAAAAAGTPGGSRKKLSRDAQQRSDASLRKRAVDALKQLPEVSRPEGIAAEELFGMLVQSNQKKGREEGEEGREEGEESNN